MARICGQEEFIAKANEVHHGKYDYSLVRYTKTDEKVKIICSEHGVFEKTPNKHLAGQGCPMCGRNRTRLTREDFIERAKRVHGDRYDYSNVVYQRMDKPVEIICPIHGPFMQTPNLHIVLGHDCPKCGHAKAGLKRRGENNVAHRQDVKDAKKATCLKKYGTTTWAGSEEGRSRLHDIIVNEGKLEKMKQTCQSRYGTDFWTQSDEGREALHVLMSSDEMRAKIVSGYKAAYGMHYMQTEKGRERAKSYIDDERREKMLQSLIEHYGVPYVVFTEEERAEVLRKSWETKRRNGTFRTSKPEMTLYKLLCDIFGEDDVDPQHVDDVRYPFHCDFYIKSRDLFIELNAHWSHGGHWFDETNSDDLVVLQKWFDRGRGRGSSSYLTAIKVWTERDLLKRQFAIDNNLNYVVFWKNNLSDAREYLSGLQVVHGETVK